ncbi:outer membrane protein assembly factor BamD [bacterium]|nr:outer membrane protein assembly factor BamD [bacterium]
MRKFRRKILLILFMAALLFLMNCGGKVKVYDDSLLAFQQAQNAYDRGKYNKAVVILEKFVFDFPGSDLVDDAHMLLGRSYYKQKDYVLAIGEFKRLIDSFPESGYAEEAEYMVGECYYKESPRPELDQEHTNRAIEWLESFIEYYPESEYVSKADSIIRLCREKLAVKEYKNAELYFKMNKYDAALLYANLLMETYPESDMVCSTLFLIAEIYGEKEEYESAEEYYNKVLDICPENKDLIENSIERLKEVRP